MSKFESHYLNEIISNPNELAPQVMEHIKQCESCHNELLMVRRIEKAISTADLLPLPTSLKATIMERVLMPGVSLRQLIWGAILTLLSPLVLQYLTMNHPGINLEKNLQIYLFALYGTLLSLLLFALTYRFFYVDRSNQLRTSEWFDSMLSQGSEIFQRLFK